MNGKNVAEMEAVVVIIAIGLIALGLLLAFAVLMYGFAGAVLQFTWASEAGFIGIIVCLAAWVFMFPIMLIWAVLWGWTASRQSVE
ncbi:hypothetical protein OAM68_01415 [Planktomarina temperata]|jgi:hypothetical protein|nr:hypothetical protein [Planktomarina temperata]MDC0381619.1 hypothetical protein [Planktomarina temperata]MDC1282284.1 hypothetical protein [bacterium]MDC3264869.1 hypothetical protein [Planktomarina temperata]